MPDQVRIGQDVISGDREGLSVLRINQPRLVFSLAVAKSENKRLLMLTIIHVASGTVHSEGGYVNQNTSNLYANAGKEGDYWSSTPNSSSSNAYNLNFNGTSNVNPSNNNNRNNGFSVRCILLCPISAKLASY